MIVTPFRTVKESIDLVNSQRSCGAVSIWSQDISLSKNSSRTFKLEFRINLFLPEAMEVAANVQVGTVWINSIAIDKGVQPRKMTGNYASTGEKSLLNFQRPKWTEQYAHGESSNFETEIKAFGAADASATVLRPEPLADLKTYKLYIGGKQTRPDAQSSSNYYLKDSSGTKTLYALLPDAGRKDVRNAVEAAHAAFNE